MFWLKKLIGFWLMPLPLSLILIVVGAICWRYSRRKRLGRGLTVAGALWLIIFSNYGVGSWLVHRLETSFAAIPALPAETPVPAALARCQFVVVLGGGHSFVEGWPANNQLSPSALSRIVEGVRLVRRLPGARLIVTGPADPDVAGSASHARLLADVAESLGVARDRIIEVAAVRDTEDETAAIRQISQGAPVALVTSAWHLPRAIALSRRQGIDVLACPSDYAARIDHVRTRDFFRWNVSGLEYSTKAVYETLGGLWSQWRGKT